uniref:Uncharacterized protein n=1 Tax=Anopheles culicifacies TaxID=139723 RepID=A0A182MJJ0_9DIPT
MIETLSPPPPPPPSLSYVRAGTHCPIRGHIYIRRAHASGQLRHYGNASESKPTTQQFTTNFPTLHSTHVCGVECAFCRPIFELGAGSRLAFPIGGQDRHYPLRLPLYTKL